MPWGGAQCALTAVIALKTQKDEKKISKKVQSCIDVPYESFGVPKEDLALFIDKLQSYLSQNNATALLHRRKFIVYFCIFIYIQN